MFVALVITTTVKIRCLDALLLGTGATRAQRSALRGGR